VYYSATIFAYAGFDNATATGLVVSGTNWFFTIVAMFILDRVGKRRILLCTYPGMIVGLALASVAFWKMTEETGHRLVEGSVYPTQWTNMMLGMMIVFIAFYATGSGNITWTVGELFPLEMRGIGSAVLAGGIWAANIVISATFLTLMNAIGPTPTFALYAGICLFGLVFIFFSRRSRKSTSTASESRGPRRSGQSTRRRKHTFSPRPELGRPRPRPMRRRTSPTMRERSARSGRRSLPGLGIGSRSCQRRLDVISTVRVV
jgi:MFS family permease